MKDRKDSIRELIDYMGGPDYGSSIVLHELIRWLDVEIIEKFTKDFKVHHKIMGYNDYDLCLDCQETYDINENHICKETQSTLPPLGNNKFFSSYIPEC